MSKHKYQYKYEEEQIYGQNKIFCGKKIVVGEKYYTMLLTFFIFSLPYIISIVFFLKCGPLELYQNIIYITISSILYIIHIYSLLKGGCTDPGILPRQNKDLYYETVRTSMRYKILGHMHRVNYCYSCYLFRPPRTSHCAVCDNCVERFDHHCVWLGTCIGKRNYKYFYALLGSLNISAIFEIIFCVYALYLDIKKIQNKDNKGYTFIIVVGCIILYNLLFVIIFIGKLFILHTYLVFKGLTFYEYSKEKMKIFPQELNPFNRYKFFSNKCILFLKKTQSHLLDVLNKRGKSGKESDIEIINLKTKKKKLYKKDKIKFKKEKVEKNSNDNNKSGIKIKYLNTYQDYESSCLKKKTLGNNLILKQNKKKYTDENKFHLSSSKRTIGNITFDFNGIISNQSNKINKSRYNNSSSESSKEIDFEKNVNVVINPYCIIAEKKKKPKNKNINIEQNKNPIIERNENIIESPFHEVDIKHKKIIFSNL